LDAGVGISYNSLVWIKDTTNSEIIFDPDSGNAGPGFRLGLPVVEGIYYDTVNSRYAFIMVNPDGSRTEFRRVGSTDTYESGDSSYRELKVTSGNFDMKGGITQIAVTSTDGTMMLYTWKTAAARFMCTEIKDRNGNYISVAYSGSYPTTMTDTLGRVITINYDGGGYPTSITQDWKATNGEGSTTTHTWATFSYTNATVSTSFSGLTVIGPANSTTVKVLEKITYPDSSFTKFEYNGYIQVKKISQVAADSTSHILNYVTTDLASVSGSQTDCPRFGETKTWVENFNGGSEVVVTNSLTTGATYSLPNSITGSATRIDVAMTGHPDGLYTRTYVGASGYKEGLTLATEDCTGSNCATRLRWTWTDWTQDNTGVSYITNPRVIESRVGDGTNIKKTTIGYGSNGFGLPELVQVYDSDLSTVLKAQTTGYSTDTAYINRRIIGLPLETKLYQGTTSGTLMSKVTYAYDEGNLTGTDPVQNISPVQHDNTNYSSSFVTGRGLLTSVTRWDATAPTTSGSAVTSSMKYNTAGAVVSKTDPLSHTVKIAYTDDFNASGMPTTYAYPTTITDQAGNSSTVKYRYDIGANVEATSPAPAGQTYGKKSKRLFDSIGRLDRQSVYVNTTEKAYTRYEYPTNGVQSVSYTPIVDADGDNNIAEDEVLNESWFDGAGRVRRSRTEHPGSTGGWTATQTEYDILGRTYRTSVPTEVSVSGSTWTAAGDDSTRGWIWNYQEYDWKGRVTRTIPSDSTGSDGKDTLISYAGCGCAGGMETTIEGPSVPRTDTSGDARRKQTVYEDILGRNFKTESFEWDGSTVYSTLVNTFNGRDQVTNSRLYSGTTSSSTYQDTTMTYDGHGRVATKHMPQQDTGIDTVYEYNLDDTIARVTDARLAATNYTYNSRKLVTGIEWTMPVGPGIPDIQVPDPVSFSYDNLGNRTEMDDQFGTTSYVYDSLSRMTSESRQFSDEIANAPQGDNTFEINYTYTLSGQLKSITDPWAITINYTQDRVGRLTTVAPSTSFGGVSTFASNGQYRAWGALKHLEYSNGVEMDQTFDNGLRASTYELETSTVNVMDKSYEYNNDGSLKLAEDALNWKFDRSYTYDHQTRLKDGKSSTEATGTEITNGGDQIANLPYRQSHSYDAFNNMTARTNKIWGGDANSSYSFTNNRISGSTWAYDADGRMTATGNPEPAAEMAYNAAGQLSFKYDKREPTDHEDKTYLYYDGDGRVTKRVTDQCRKLIPLPPEEPPEDCEWWGENATYSIRSTVLGGEVLAEVNFQSAALHRYIFAGGAKFGELSARNEGTWPYNYTVDAAQYYHQDAAGVTQRVTRNSPESLLGDNGSYPNYIDPRQTESETGGANVGLVSNYVQQPAPPSDPVIPFDGEASIFLEGQWRPVLLDGVRMSRQALRMMGLAGALQVNLYFQGHVVAQRDVTETNGNLSWESSVTVRGRVSKDSGFLVPGSVTQTSDTSSISWNNTSQSNDDWKSPFHFFSSDKRLSDADCDSKMSKIFGGVAKAMEGGKDLRGIDRTGTLGLGHSATPKGEPYIMVDGVRKRNTDNGGIIHVYTNEEGTATGNTPLFAIGGWIGTPVPYGGKNRKTGDILNSGLVFNYPGGITMEFVHTGTDNENYIPSVPNNPGSQSTTEIGWIGGWGGGAGGMSKNYNHTHIVFFKDKAKNIRLDPRTLFCGW
jgi:YD repeat-containing protein